MKKSIPSFKTRDGARECLSIYVNSFNFTALSQDYDLWLDITEYFTHE